MSLSQWFNDCAKGARGFGRNLGMLLDADGERAKKALGRVHNILNEDPRAKSLSDFVARSLVRTAFKPFMKAMGTQGADRWTKRPTVFLNPKQDDEDRALTILHEYRHVQQERMEGRIRPDFRTLRDAIIYNRLIEGDAGAASGVIIKDILDKRRNLAPPAHGLTMAERMERGFFLRQRDELDSYDREMVLKYYKDFMKIPDSSMPRLDLSRSRKMLISGVEVNDPKYMVDFSDQALEKEILKFVGKDVLAVVAAIDNYRESCADMKPDVAVTRKEEIRLMVAEMKARGKVISQLERKGWANPYKPPAPETVA